VGWVAGLSRSEWLGYCRERALGSGLALAAAADSDGDGSALRVWINRFA
jgi:hypothetical protein